MKEEQHSQLSEAWKPSVKMLMELNWACDTYEMDFSWDQEACWLLIILDSKLFVSLPDYLFYNNEMDRCSRLLLHVVIHHEGARCKNTAN